MLRYSYKIYRHISVGDSGWISYYDINNLVSKDDYMHIEMSYLNLILHISKVMLVSEFEICELENPHKLKYYEGEFIPLKRITTLIRKILRERIWCKLYSKQLQIHFGYDYCMYIVSSKNLIEYFKDFNNVLNIQLSPSPYLQE